MRLLLNLDYLDVVDSDCEIPLKFFGCSGKACFSASEVSRSLSDLAAFMRRLARTVLDEAFE